MGSLHDPCEPRKPLPGRPGDPAARLACRRTRGRATAHVHSPPAAQDRTVEPPLPPGQRARARLLPDVRLTSTTLEALDQLLLGFSRTIAPFGTRRQSAGRQRSHGHSPARGDDDHRGGSPPTAAVDLSITERGVYIG